MNAITEFFIMQISLIAVVLILHTYMGLHIIRRGIIFSDLVLDQLAAFGVVVGISLGVHYGTALSYLFALVAVLGGCVLLSTINPKKRKIPEEAFIGIFYGMALVASLLLADKMADGGTYFNKTLVGSMLWVSWPLIITTVAIYILLAFLHYIFRNYIIQLTDAPDKLKHYTLWNFLFFVSQGIITILIVPVAGVLLAYGFLMIPAAIGLLFSKRWGPALIIGWSAGMVSCLLGIIFSYYSDSPYGPSLLLSMGVFFIAALLIHVIVSRTKKQIPTE